MPVTIGLMQLSEGRRIANSSTDSALFDHLSNRQVSRLVDVGHSMVQTENLH